MGIGAMPGVTLAAAREVARAARIQIGAGQDPLLERRRIASERAAAQSKLLTFEEAAKQLVDAKRPEWKSAKHAAQWDSTLSKYAYPAFGSLVVSDVDVTLVMSVLRPIWKTKTATAKRLRGRIEQVLDWAKAHGYRQGENPAAWKGYLDKLLAAPSKVAKVVHHKAVAIDGMPAFMRSLRTSVGLSARALEFQILTTARSGEVRGAVWGEVDLDYAVWTVPPERMKAGKEHRVPLSPDALLLLKSLVQRKADDLIFPGAKPGRPLSDMSLTAVMRRMSMGEVPHGFRSTFRDWAAERTDTPRDVIEKALAHVVANQTEAAYFRSDLFEKRRLLMDAWAGFCAG